MSEWGENNTRVKRDFYLRQSLEMSAEEREGRRIRGRWNGIIWNVKKYWDYYIQKDQTSMDGIISTLKETENYGLDFDKDILGEYDNDDLKIEWEETDSDGNLDINSYQVVSYYGHEVWKCRYCYKGTNYEDIFAERMLNNWVVPVCEQCENEDNRPAHYPNATYKS